MITVSPTGNANATHRLRYRQQQDEADAFYEVRFTAEAVELRRGPELLASAELSTRAQAVSIDATDARHRVQVDGETVLTILDPDGPLDGRVELEATAGGFSSLEVYTAGASDSTGIEREPTTDQRTRAAAVLDATVEDEVPPAPPALPNFAATAGSGDDGGGDDGGSAGEDSPPAPSDEDIRAALAPPQDLTVPTTLHKVSSFLYEGAAPTQQGADPMQLIPSRIALLHGEVRDELGLPVDGAEISALGHPEFGSATSRSDGTYDLVVAGGGPLSVVIAKPGFLSVQRPAETRIGDSHKLDDAVLLEVDTEASLIEFIDPIEVHHAFTLNDGWPDRMTSLMFRAGTQATMRYADDTTAPLPSMTIRTTEYTVGPDGPERMPGLLPPNTAYNYALEISADEAEATGAVSVDLDTPAVLYVDNFRNWPVGAIAPNGSFDRLAGRWHAEPNGRVIRVLGVTGGLAEIDITGDDPPVAASATELQDLGFTADERAELASIYADGAELWRLELTHFTPYDINPTEEPTGVPPPDELGPEDPGFAGSCEGPGSIIEYDNQGLGESLALAGTPLTLEYRSDRTRGAPNRGIRMEVTTDEVPEGVAVVALLVSVAGRDLVTLVPPAPNSFAEVQWDGLDAFGRPTQGPQPIDVCVGYGFPDPGILLARAADGGGGGGVPQVAAAMFGSYPPGAFVLTVPGVNQHRFYTKCYGNEKAVAAASIGAITKADKYRLGGLDAHTISDGLGGWTLANHHTLARSTATFYGGDGRVREVSDEALWAVTRFAGAQTPGQTSAQSVGVLTGVASGSLFPSPSGIAIDKAGSVFVATPGLIRRIQPDESVEIVAGTPNPGTGGLVNRNETSLTGYAGDEGPATAALLGVDISAIAADSRGGLYIADNSNHVVRYVDDQGIIRTVAGSGDASVIDVHLGIDEDGGDPLEPDLINIVDIALTPDEDGLLVLTGSSQRMELRLLTHDSQLIHIAGEPAPPYIDPAEERYSEDCFCPDGPACGACLTGGTFAASHPYDSVPRWFGYGVNFARTAGFDNPTAVSAADDTVYLAETGSGSLNNRIRMIDGYRGGPIDTFRWNYVGSTPLPANTTGISLNTGGVNQTLAIDDEVPQVVDLTPSGRGLLHTTTDGRLLRATDDLGTPRQLIMGGPNSDAFRGGDDVVLAQRVRLGANSDIARGPDGALYVADLQRNVVLRVLRAVPPMYLSSTLTSEDGTELYVFDEEGRHLETRDTQTHQVIWQFSYNSAGLLVAAVDAFGDTTTIHRGTSGEAQSIEAPDGQVTLLGLDENGYLNAVTGPDARLTEFEYSPTGLMTEMSDSDSLSSFDFDVRGRLSEDALTVSYVDGSGSATSEVATQELERSSTGRSHVAVSHTTAEGRVSVYERELAAPDRVERTVTLPGGEANTGFLHPDQEQVTFADGTTATTSFDLDLRLGDNTRVPNHFELTFPSGRRLSTLYARSYEPHCSLFTEDCDPLADPALDADSLTFETTQEGQVWTEVYTRAHLEAGTPVPATIIESSPTGRTRTTLLNGQGLVASVQLADVAPVDYEYDARGRLETITSSDAGQTRSLDLSYDANGFVDAVTDAFGRTSSFTRDEVGRVLQQTSPDLRVVTFTYDDDGNVESVTPPGRPSHTLRYDSADQLREYDPPAIPGVTDPETIYDYTPDRDLDFGLSPDADLVDVVHDPSTGKLSTITTPDGVYSYDYDDGVTGQLQSISGPGPTTLSYIRNGILLEEESWAGSVSGAVSWTFDSRLRPDRQYVNDDWIEVEYGEFGDGEEPTLIGDLILNFYASGDHQLHSTTLDAVASLYEFNGFGEPSSVEYVQTALTLYELSLTYDAIGRIQTKTELFDGSTRLQCYEYDLAGRLVDVYDGADSAGCTGSVVEHYGYDDNGARTMVQNSAGAIFSGALVTDDQDRLLQHGTTTFTYDDNGDLLTRTEAGATTTFDYDAMGNLQQVVLPSGGGTIDYIVDGRNRRIGKDVDGVRVQSFLYQDQLNPVAELDAAGDVVSRFVYATMPNVPDYMVRDGERYRFVVDQLGSVIAVVNAGTAELVQEREYDAFGRIISETTAPGFSQPFGFAGGIWDADIGLVRFGARDYDPETGGWTQKDPLRFGAGDSSLYRYAAGDPVNYWDLDGLIFDTVRATCIQSAALCSAAMGTGARIAQTARRAGPAVRTVAARGAEICRSAGEMVRASPVAGRATTLVAKVSESGFKPTQAGSKMNWAKVQRYAEAMRLGKWNWGGLDKIIVDKNGAILSGHHRVLAAAKSGTKIPESGIFRLAYETIRPIYEWADVLQ